MNSQALKLADAHDRHDRLVEYAKERYDVLPLGLRDELSNGTNIVQCSLSVGETHRSLKEVDLPSPTRVVVALANAYTEEVSKTEKKW